MTQKTRRSYVVGERVRFGPTNVCGVVVKTAPHTPWIWVTWNDSPHVKTKPPHLLHVSQVTPV